MQIRGEFFTVCRATRISLPGAKTEREIHHETLLVGRRYYPYGRLN